jgi:broad specificity phosphatase PhoE
MHLILIRHAESNHAHLGIFANKTSCTGLTELGFRQAQLLANRFHHTGELEKSTAIFSSPILRARQTAEALLHVLPVKTIQEIPELCELDTGEAEGLTRPEYEANFGAVDLAVEPDRPFAPGGESWSQFLSRVHNFLTDTSEKYPGQNVVAVTHSGFIYASLVTLLGIPRPGTGTWFVPQHTSITEWSNNGQRWQLERFNDTYHLISLKRLSQSSYK